MQYIIPKPLQHIFILEVLQLGSSLLQNNCLQNYPTSQNPYGQSLIPLPFHYYDPRQPTARTKVSPHLHEQSNRLFLCPLVTMSNHPLILGKIMLWIYRFFLLFPDHPSQHFTFQCFLSFFFCRWKNILEWVKVYLHKNRGLKLQNDSARCFSSQSSFPQYSLFHVPVSKTAPELNLRQQI